ncbi:MAG TPA: hypothetical protein VFJ74_04265 [Gemmatimonadaceae bacterium]|nr:hypothetical protein [Gemmatimonadaceae bacterium]
MSPVSFWRRWRDEQAQRRQAAMYVAALAREPDDADVAWLAAHDRARDADHARWELRYARRVLGLLVAERDALDDRTASLVGRALASSLRADRNVAPGKLAVAEQQLNARLGAYGDALRRRGGEVTGARLGRTLLDFVSGAGSSHDAAALAQGGELLSRYIDEANEALRSCFGAAMLPEGVRPSVAAGGGTIGGAPGSAPA